MGTTFKEAVAENKNSYTKKLFETGNQLDVADSFNPTIKFCDLTIRECYKLDEIKHIKTKFGDKSVAVIELLDPDNEEIRLCDLFLPDRLKKLEAGIPEGAYLKYNGIVEEKEKTKYPKHSISFIDKKD